MSTEARRSDWPAVRDRLHNRWPALSEDELDDTHGEQEALVALLQAKYGYARENAEGDLRLVMETPIAPGPFVATDSDDPDAVAESGTIDRPHERDVSLATGVTMHYLEWPHEGARPMVLLHGLGGCAADWQRVAAHFQGRFHIIAPDQRGHGDSHAKGGSYSADDHIADLGALIDALELERPILVGHSMGAHHALGYAAANGDRPSAVVASGLRDARAEREVAAVATRVFGSAQEYVDILRRNSPSAPDWALWSLAGARLREVRGGLQPRADAAAVMQWRPLDLEGRAEGITAPVLVIRSASGGGSSVPAAPRSVETHQLSAGGPDPFIDAEDEFLAAVNEFLDARGVFAASGQGSD